MDPAAARRCKAADPAVLGERLRAARVKLGLTQGQLADGLVSVAFISRIETGLRRPDPELLEALAGRLNVSALQLIDTPVDDHLTKVELQVDLAELALAAGDASAALAQCEEVFDATASSLTLRRRLDRVRAGALEATGDLEAAARLLETVTDQSPRDLRWIKDVISLSRCYREAGDLERAIEVADAAAAEIERVQLRGTTEAIQLTVTVAMAHADLGEVARAVDLCQDAIARADEIGSSVARASAYWNASIFESRQGHDDAALLLAKSALAVFEKGEDSRNIGRLRCLVGELLLRLDPPSVDGARAALAQGRRELEWSSAGVIEVARCDLFLARSDFLAGNIDEAQERLDQAEPIVRERAPGPHVYALILAGEIAFSSADTATARARYQDAARLLTGMGSDRAAGEHWLELAGLLEEISDHVGAMEAYKSAAASLGLVHRKRPRPATRKVVPSHR